jgi:glycosyltransferase involved in cell wall biosynthesis
VKILHLGKFYHPTPGGIETFLKNLAEGLVGAGDETTVLCSSTTHQGSEERLGGVRVIRSPSLGVLLSQPLTPTLWPKLRKLAREHDVVHVHTPNPLAELLTLGLPADKPVVVSHHSDVVRQRLILPFYIPVLKRFLRRSNRIAVATRSHITHSSFLPDFAAKCEVIPYGLDPIEATPETADAAQRLRQKHGRFILFVGRLVGYKGVIHLIQAMPKIDATLVIVGEGPLRPSLEEEARKLGGAQKIRFVGNIADPNDFRAHYEACELLVLPSVSKNEAFGLVQLEAMAFGKPTVVSRLDSGIVEVNEDGVTGLHVPPRDSEALSSAVSSLLADDARRSAMGQAARRRFLERFTREKMVGTYRKLYEKTIES